MNPVFTQEFVSDTQSLLATGAIAQNAQETAETARKVRASFTMLSLAFSLGVSGSLVSSAEAADSMQLAALPSVSGAAGTLSSFGSDRPDGAAATYHTVADGETIWDIARSHGVSVEDIKVANGIQEDQTIQAGQVLKVPAQVAVATPSSTLVIESTSAEAEDRVRSEVAEPDEVLVAVERLEHEQSSPVSLTEFLQDQQVAVPEAAESNRGEQLAVVVPPASQSRAETFDSMAAPSEAVQPLRSSAVNAAKREETKANLAALVQLPGSSTNEWVAPNQFQEGRPVEATVHEVSSGETLWSIARQYRVEPAYLEDLNQIEDPSRLVPGDRLLVPTTHWESEVSEAPGVAALPASQSEVEVAPVAAAIARLPQREAIQQVQASATEVTHTAAITDESEQEETAADTEGVEAVPQAADPFVASMLSEVTGDVTVAQSVPADSEVVVLAAEPGVIAIATSEDAPSEADDAVTSEPSTAAAAIVNVEFAPEGQAVSLDPSPDVAGFSPEELLAVAPLGSEVYAPVVAPVAGQVVSPDMPVLPAQDQFLPEAPARFNGYMWPAQGVLTSGYGWRWGRMHRGIDIAGPVGTPIYAAASGTVVSSGWNSGGYGNLVDIRHEDGSLTRYAHNSRLLVRAGERVAQGQQIAEMGSTGYSTGPHLHFEIHPPGQGAVNPMAYLQGR